MFPLGMENKNEFTSDNLLQSAIIICLYASMRKHALLHIAFPCDWTIQSDDYSSYSRCKYSTALNQIRCQ